jgi:signal transduction histidine kinase
MAVLDRIVDGTIWPISLKKSPPEFTLTFTKNGIPLEEAGWAHQAYREQQPVFGTWTPDKEYLVLMPGFEAPHSRLFVPLIIEEQVFGLMMLVHRKPDYYNNQIADRLTVFVNQLTIAYQRADLFEQHRKLMQQIVMAQEAERQRVAHELHDDAGQSLTALQMNLQMLREDFVSEPQLHERITSVIQLTQATAEQIRNVSYKLRPPLLDTLGLNLALQGLCDDFAEYAVFEINYNGREVTGLSEVIQISLYRILQESLTNIAKHAAPNTVNVSISQDNTTLTLDIVDDGRGFKLDPAASYPSRSGLGLLGMRERTELLGGKFDIQSKPGQGTHIRVTVPTG